MLFVYVCLTFPNFLHADDYNSARLIYSDILLLILSLLHDDTIISQLLAQFDCRVLVEHSQPLHVTDGDFHYHTHSLHEMYHKDGFAKYSIGHISLHLFRDMSTHVMRDYVYICLQNLQYLKQVDNCEKHLTIHDNIQHISAPVTNRKKRTLN